MSISVFSPSVALRNLPNVGNTCYLSSTLVSLFLGTDSFDGLLTTSPRAPSNLRKALVHVVTVVRDGKTPSPPDLRALVSALHPAWRHNGRQHDAAEFLSHLLDALRAPFIPMMRTFSHAGAPDANDSALCTERILWLQIATNNAHATVSSMLQDYFSAQSIQGLQRGGKSVDATEVRVLIPEYAAMRETGETTAAERYLFHVINIPVAISRFDVRGNKLRTSVHISVQIDARKYLRNFAADNQWFMTLCAVICHRGASISSGHYVAYTRAGAREWRRWNDMRGGAVERCESSSDGLPTRGEWRDELRKDAYLLFYDLGDGSLPGRERHRMLQFLADRKLAEQVQLQEDQHGAFRQQLLDATGVYVSGDFGDSNHERRAMGASGGGSSLTDMFDGDFVR
ncbi:Ubiquitin carboxyl-terminal hydrolase 17-like protein E [Gracilariopsis chorda]|uniref:ubiquitinyl hydrolase 1 n=1 Tax=Gracilariopsis chorda TaxID=448386 RepID=A0A2V3IVK5_9FLOR|nr:Ubiquitin carboxyl-terminal hydrolase 17-like protein E [Gracilariopsis chorda]|eukprot:PXF46115.1 Ubiquitin carboxyl-terminal hydrolase 17-like protein E [Gracilariopsis chorda]